MKLFKQVYIYFLAYFINAALSFLTLSLLTHYLSPTDYGIINLYSSFIIFLMPFISGGVLYPLSVEYFKRPGNTYKEFFTNAQTIPLLSLGLCTLICVIFQHPLSAFLGVSPFWILIIPVTTWLIMINEIVMMITRNRSKPVQFAFFSVGKNLLEILFTIALVIGLKMTWDGRLASAAMAPLLLGFLSVFLFFKWDLISKKVDWKQVKRILFLSLPFIFERLSIFVLGYSDKYFINEYDLNKTAEVGIYGLGSQIATIIQLVIVSTNSAYHPYLFKSLADGFTGKIHKTTFWYIGGCAIAVGGVCLGTPILFRFFIAKEYHDAQLYAYMLSAGYFMWGIYNAFLGYLLFLEKNRQILFISLIGMITSIICNFILVPKLGATGAAITSMFTYMIMALSCFLYVRKYFLLKK